MPEQAQVHDHRNAERPAVPAEHGAQTRADPRAHQEGAAAQAEGSEAAAGARMVGGTHYIEMRVQPWDVFDTWPMEQRIGAYRANAVKYLMRLGTKDERLQEAKKAAHYCAKLVEVLEAQAD